MTDVARRELDDAQYAYLQMLLDAGCKFQFRTFLFGKTYVWMKDPSGTTFLERVPDSSPSSFSIDGQTGEVTAVR